jgi:hypothetical protein
MERSVIRIVLPHYLKAFLVLLDVYQELTKQGCHRVTLILSLARSFQFLSEVSVEFKVDFWLISPFEFSWTNLWIKILILVRDEVS